MRNYKVFMFSGQGSQYYQMGRELYENNMIFRRYIVESDMLIKKICGYSALKVLFDDKNTLSDKFDELKYTHPSIFMIEYALAMTLIDEGLIPDCVVGSSLGEIVAMVIADIITLEDAIKLVFKQVEAFGIEECSGSMMSILEGYDIYDNLSIISKNAEVVSINYDSNFVISSTREKIASIQEEIRERDIVSQVLPVNVAFHSSILDHAKDDFLSFEKNIKKAKPKITFYSSCSGRKMETFDNDYIWQVARNKILFRDVVFQLEDQYKPLYIDLGPAGTLANTVKYNIGLSNKDRCITVMSPFTRKKQEDINYISDLISIL